MLLAAIACSLPATAQLSDEVGKRSHLLPHIADGDGWRSFLLVTNVSQSPSPCTLQLQGLTVDRFEEEPSVTAADSSAAFELPGSGGSLAWGTRNESGLASGYATLDCAVPVVAQVVFAAIGESGAARGMATVFGSGAGTVFQFPVLTREATLGLAIANDSDADATCRLVLEDPERMNLGEAELSVAAKSNLARMVKDVVTIPEEFPGGTATVACDRQVTMIGLHFELQQDGTIITFNTLSPAVLDASTQSSDETPKRVHLLPHIADGDGWRSFLLVTNVSQSSSPCTLQLQGLTVDRFEEVDGVTAAGSTAIFELPGSGGNLVWGTRNESRLASGYATLDCAVPVVAQVVFAAIGESGAARGMATVFGSGAGKVFQFPVLTREATLGLAIANDSDADATCRLVLEDRQRVNLGETELSVASRSNLAEMVKDVIAIPENFPGGTATVSCDRQVAMIGLHFELQSDGTIVTFNTLPPAILDTPPPRVTISASPASIDWGRSTTLSWSSTHAVSAAITPDIGKVSGSGSHQVSPTVTTIYRIAVTGAGRRTAMASITVTVIVSERVLLAALYRATGGPNWTKRDNWLTNRPLEAWHGVDVDEHGRVTSLSLTENGLWGEIPLELSAFANLTTLDLSHNDLTGAIPPQLGGLSNLTYLNLDGNDLIGAIPPQLGSLAKLRTLRLHGNKLTGAIPPQLGGLSNLTSLNLGGNGLTGAIPPELGALFNLTSLSLVANDLTGSIPPQLGSLSNLESFYLALNDFTGPIPVELGALYNLWYLNLDGNSLTGVIPPSLGALSKLETLNLYSNRLMGEVPEELGSLSNLKSLNLGNNELNGAIPAQLGWLSNLTSLVLSYNGLTGVIPAQLRSLSNLTTLSLSSNDGLCVPGSAEFVTWSKGIEYLNVEFCNDSDRAILEALYELAGGSGWINSTGWLDDGALSEWYGVGVDALGRVTALDLSNNGLAGRLPKLLGRLAQMTGLRIEGNALSGRLPLSLSFLSALREFHYADTKLCARSMRRFGRG